MFEFFTGPGIRIVGPITITPLELRGVAVACRGVMLGAFRTSLLPLAVVDIMPTPLTLEATLHVWDVLSYLTMEEACFE